LIREAFGEGRLSYSQVRALTRVEKVVEEEKLLSLARHATAAQLERLVRAYRGVVARAEAAEHGGPERWVRWSHADDGSLLLQARLPAEEGAVVLEALQAGVERLGAAAEAPAYGAPALEAASAEAPEGGAPAVERASAEAPPTDGAAVDPVSAEARAASPEAAEAASAEAPRADGAAVEPAFGGSARQ
jgi:hypothetical protein